MNIHSIGFNSHVSPIPLQDRVAIIQNPHRFWTTFRDTVLSGVFAPGQKDFANLKDQVEFFRTAAVEAVETSQKVSRVITPNMQNIDPFVFDHYVKPYLGKFFESFGINASFSEFAFEISHP